MRPRHPVAGRVAPTVLHPATVIVDAPDCVCGYVVTETEPRLVGRTEGEDLIVAFGGIEHLPGCQPKMHQRLGSITITLDGVVLPPLVAYTGSKGVQGVLRVIMVKRIFGDDDVARLHRLAAALSDPHGWSGGDDDAMQYLADFALDADRAEPILPIARAGFTSLREYDLWVAEGLTGEQARAWRPVTNAPEVAQQAIRVDVTAEQYADWVAAVPPRRVVPHPVVMRTTADDGWTVEHAAAVWAAISREKAPHELPNAYPATIAFCSRHQHRSHAMVAAAVTAGLSEEEMVRGLTDGTLTKDILGTLAALNG